MVNIIGGIQDRNNSPLFVAPRASVLGGGTGFDTPQFAASTGISAAEHQQDSESWVFQAPRYAGAGLVDLVATVSSVMPGIERNDVHSSVYESLGIPDFDRWRRAHMDGVEITSGLVGALTIGIAAEVAVARALTSGAFAASGIGRTLAPVINMTTRAQRASRLATLTAARSGQALTALEGASWRYIGAKAAEYAGRAAVGETAVVALLNQNSMVWSDDMKDNIMWGAFGIGLGGVLGSLSARSMIRRYNNSDIVQTALSRARDPYGYADTVLKAAGAAMPEGQSFAPKLSALATNEFLAASADLNASSSAIAIQRGSQDGLFNNGLDYMHRLTQKGLKEYKLPQSLGFNAGSPQSRALQNAVKEDTTLLYGAATLSKVQDSLRQTDELFDVLVDDLINQIQTGDMTKAEVAEAQARIRRIQTEVPLALTDGKWLPIADADLIHKTNPLQLRGTITTGDELAIKWRTGRDVSLRLSQQGKLSRKLATLEAPELIEAAEMGNRLMQRMLRGRETMIVPKDADAFAIDMAIEYESRGGSVQWLAKYRDSDEAALASLRMKAKELEGKDVLNFEDRLKLNLPFPNSYERVVDPYGEGLLKVIRASTADGATMKTLMDLRMELGEALDLLTTETPTLRMDGNIFRFNRESDELGAAWQPPVYARFERQAVDQWTRTRLDESIIYHKGEQLSMMTDSGWAGLAPMMQNVVSRVRDMPMFRDTLDINGLMDTQISGLANGLSAAASQWLTRGMRYRDNKVLQAAFAIRKEVGKITDAFVDEALTRMRPATEAIMQTGAARSRVLLNQYLSHAQGWDIRTHVKGADGYWHYILDHRSEANRERLKRMGLDLGKNTPVPKLDGSGPLVLDDLAEAARGALQREFNRILAERNAVRIARGIEPIKRKPYYIPPESTRNKHVGFVIDQYGKVVPGRAVIAETVDSFRRQAELAQEGLQPGERFYTREQMAKHADLWFQAELDWFDSAHMAAPSGKQQGLLTKQPINPRAYEDALVRIKHSYEQLSTGTLGAVFDAQLKAARLQSDNIARMTDVAGKHQKNIFDEFREALIGVPASANPTGGVSNLLQNLDESLDGYALSVAEGTRVPRQSISATLATFGIKRDVADIKSYEAMAKDLGPHMPFAKFTDYLEHETRTKAPWKAKEVARNVLSFSAGVLLRWVEVSHALMNMSGLIVAMPALLKSPSIPIVGKVQGVNVIDTNRIMAQGLERMVRRKKYLRDHELMERNGDMTQDFAELNHMLDLMDHSRNGFQRAVFGDPKYAKWRQIKDKRERFKYMTRFKGIEGMLSIITDTSEDWSRQISHHTGLALADHAGIVGDEARHAFARQFADNVIADYDPLNRPEIYQSSVGMLVGQFLSFTQNYYQRLFRWIETEQYGAATTNLGMQAALFGVFSMPGMRQIADMFGGEEDGDSFMDKLYKSYGPQLGSVIAQGGLNQLPTIFGLPAVALHTRGDASIRHPVIGAQTPVGIEVMSDLIRGSWEVMTKTLDANVEMTPRHAAEIWARNMPNRVIRGLLTVNALEGSEVDAYGNVMADTQNMFESAYRMLGVRSARQQAEIEAYFTNRKQLAMEAEKMDRVRQATRALVRAGDFNRIPAVFEDYLNAGGMPWNFRSWVQTIMADATSTRTQNQLMKALRSPSMQQLAQRIQWYTGY